MAMPNASDDAENSDLSYVAGGNVKWPLWKSLVVSLKSKYNSYHMTQQLYSWAFMPKKGKLTST